jgi:hypothetical protein
LIVRLPLLHPEHVGIGGPGAGSRNGRPRRWLPRPSAIFAAFVKMDELLVADKKVADVHISISSHTRVRVYGSI